MNKFLHNFLALTLVLTMLFSVNTIYARELKNNDVEFTWVKLTEEEVQDLLNQSEVSPAFENHVYCRPVKTGTDKVGVEFTNSGMIFDRIDYIETNLLIWENSINESVVGYKISTTHLPVGIKIVGSKYIHNYIKAQTIGGYYIDGFGTELGIGTASGFLYNN